MELLPIDAAQARLMALVAPLGSEPATLDEAAGRWLAEPLIALRDQPWTALSAMDGYAVRWADLPGPWTLAGAIQAGGLPPEAALAPGTAMRIFTGAPMPPGADAVVLQEDVDADGTTVRLTGEGPAETNRHVRSQGSDFTAHDALLPAGTRLGPPQLALAALAGHGALPVHGRPRVAIVSTGDELVPPGTPCPPGKLPASNGVMLRAMATKAGAVIASECLVPDDLPAITAALAAAGSADIIVTSGGASVGDHDLVRPALEAAGGSIDFWRIAMRPGKPLIVGRLGNAIVLGLPGNPVSAMATGALFLLPLIRRLAGSADPLPKPRALPLGADMPPVGKRAEFVRANVRDGVATPLSFQDSAAMHAASLADALIYRPIEAPAARAGDLAQVFDWTALGLA
ncbi:MAG: molybdopterin molybdotransferase MoeA [Sphingobium sp.]|nr:molybdopterin molybdotransferase MoeA [Sphingobium sp.]